MDHGTGATDDDINATDHGMNAMDDDIDAMDHCNDATGHGIDDTNHGTDATDDGNDAIALGIDPSEIWTFTCTSEIDTDPPQSAMPCPDDSSAADAARFQETTQTRGARKKRSHPWLPS